MHPAHKVGDKVRWNQTKPKELLREFSGRYGIGPFFVTEARPSDGRSEQQVRIDNQNSVFNGDLFELVDQ
jgi:hypothetical protein